MSLITLTPSKLPLTAAPLAFYSSASSTIGFDKSIPYSDSTLDIPYSRYNRSRIPKLPILSAKSQSSAIESMSPTFISLPLRPSPREYTDVAVTDVKKTEASALNTWPGQDHSPSIDLKEAEWKELLSLSTGDLASYDLISSPGSVYNKMKGLSFGDAMLLAQLSKRITTLGAQLSSSWNWILVGAHWLWSRLRFLAGRKCKTGSGRRFNALDQSKAEWVFFMLQYARRRAGWWLG